MYCLQSNRQPRPLLIFKRRACVENSAFETEKSWPCFLIICLHEEQNSSNFELKHFKWIPWKTLNLLLQRASDNYYLYDRYPPLGVLEYQPKLLEKGHFRMLISRPLPTELLKNQLAKPLVKQLSF